MAPRLHINRSKGKIHGGIYATRLATHFKIQIRQHDYPLPKVYLDRQAIAQHQFIDSENTTMDVPYNLVFSVDTHDVIPLLAPALFDPIAMGGYMIMLEDFVAYRNNLAATEEEPQELDPQVSAPQHFNIGPHGFFEW